MDQYDNRQELTFLYNWEGRCPWSHFPSFDIINGKLRAWMQSLLQLCLKQCTRDRKLNMHNRNCMLVLSYCLIIQTRPDSWHVYFILTAVSAARLCGQTYLGSFILRHDLNQISAKLISIHVAIRPLLILPSLRWGTWLFSWNASKLVLFITL